MTRPGIEPRSPGPLANTLTAGPMSQLNWYKLNQIRVGLGVMATKVWRHTLPSYRVPMTDGDSCHNIDFAGVQILISSIFHCLHAHHPKENTDHKYLNTNKFLRDIPVFNNQNQAIWNKLYIGLVLTVCQPISGYFISIGQGRAFIVCSYVHLCSIVSWFFLHTV